MTRPTSAPDDSPTPADLLRAARVLAGLTKSQAARACGKYPPGWHDWESGRQRPSPAALARALTALCERARQRWAAIAARHDPPQTELD